MTRVSHVAQTPFQAVGAPGEKPLVLPASSSTWRRRGQQFAVRSSRDTGDPQALKKVAGARFVMPCRVAWSYMNVLSWTHHAVRPQWLVQRLPFRHRAPLVPPAVGRRVLAHVAQGVWHHCAPHPTRSALGHCYNVAQRTCWHWAGMCAKCGWPLSRAGHQIIAEVP